MKVDESTEEVVRLNQRTLSVITSYLVLPLYLLFWICDWLYVPELKWEFLGYRLVTCVLLLGINFWNQKVNCYKGSFFLCGLATFVTAFFITVMIARTGGVESLYFAGLMLVLVGSLSFIHWTKKLIPWIIVVICGPYVAVCISSLEGSPELLSIFIVKLAFFMGVSVVAVIVSQFNTSLRYSEIQTRMEMEAESRRLKDTIASLNKAQAELVESSKLASIGTLAAGLAHEINNSMNFVSLSIPLLKRSVDTKRDPEIVEVLNALEEGVRRTVDIVKALKSHSASPSNPTVEVNLTESVRNTVVILGDCIKSKSLQVTIDSIVSEGYCIHTTMFNQTLMNLLSNAIDASPIGGAINIRLYSDAQFLRLIVRDDGQGIDDKLRRRIFDPFFTTKTVGKGTGLGLFIVKVGLDKIGGKLDLVSRPGGPTEFIVDFPILKSEQGVG